MASVDNRVVQMEFDNRSFQQKIGVTTSSLDKLKASLDFSKQKGMTDGISNATQNISFMGNAVQNVSSGFSVLAGAAAVALGGIATQAISVGLQLVKSLSLDQVITGFRIRNQYEFYSNDFSKH